MTCEFVHPDHPEWGTCVAAAANHEFHQFNVFENNRLVGQETERNDDYVDVKHLKREEMRDDIVDKTHRVRENKREVTRRERQAINHEDAERQARPGWAVRNHPQTSHDTEFLLPEGTVTDLQWAVLWGHWKLGAASEAEVKVFLIREGIGTGNIDNVRRRRGEMSNPERGFVPEEWIERAPRSEVGLGRTLSGRPEGATRYRCTPAGVAMAQTVDTDYLRRVLPVRESDEDYLRGWTEGTLSPVQSEDDEPEPESASTGLRNFD